LTRALFLEDENVVRDIPIMDSFGQRLFENHLTLVCPNLEQIFDLRRARLAMEFFNIPVDKLNEDWAETAFFVVLAARYDFVKFV